MPDKEIKQIKATQYELVGEKKEIKRSKHF